MGKLSIIAFVLIAAGASWSRLAVSDTQRAQAGDRGEHQSEILASQAAHSGHAEAAHVLTSGGAVDLTEKLAGVAGSGTYEVSFTATEGPPLDVIVRSEGRVGDSRHVVEALYRDEDGRGEPATVEERLKRIPPYMRYSVFSNNAMRLALLPRVQSGGRGVNADIHTNGNLNLALSLQALLGMEAVQGFGTYSDRLLHLPLLSSPNRAFRPVENPSNAETLRRTDNVAYAPFEVESVLAAKRARGHEIRTESGGIRLLGRVQLGTKDNPVVLHVPGDLVLVDVRFDGYGVIVVEGAVIAEATLTGLMSRLLGRVESQVGVFAAGPIVFNGVGEIEGHYLSNKSITFAGANTIYGGVAAGGSVNFLVAPTIRYLPPSRSITIGVPHNPEEKEMELVSVREWEVVPS